MTHFNERAKLVQINYLEDNLLRCIRKANDKSMNQSISRLPTFILQVNKTIRYCIANVIKISVSHLLYWSIAAHALTKWKYTRRCQLPKKLNRVHFSVGQTCDEQWVSVTREGQAWRDARLAVVCAYASQPRDVRQPGFIRNVELFTPLSG